MIYCIKNENGRFFKEKARFFMGKNTGLIEMIKVRYLSIFSQGVSNLLNEGGYYVAIMD